MHKHTKASYLIITVIILTGLGAWIQFKDKKIDTLPATNIGKELEKANIIRLESPRPNEVIKSPLVLKGEARGYWFFEASFPISLVDWDGRIIGQGFATADGEWMTVEFVPFTATVNFTVDPDVYSKRGFLILQKDNPSGLPEHDDALEIPIMYE